MIPAVLFASRYALVEIVLHTCEFQGLLYVFFTILSVDFFIRSRRFDSWWLLTLSALAFGMALLSKESAIVLPALLIVYGWLFDDSVFRREYLVHPAVALAWAVLFILVLTRDQSAGFIYDFSLANVLRNYATYFLDFSNLVSYSAGRLDNACAGGLLRRHMVCALGLRRSCYRRNCLSLIPEVS